MGIKDIVKAKPKTDNKAAASKTGGTPGTAGKADDSGTAKADKKAKGFIPSRSEKKAESVKPAKPDKKTKPEKTAKPDKKAKPEKTARPDKKAKPEKNTPASKNVKSEKPAKAPFRFFKKEKAAAASGASKTADAAVPAAGKTAANALGSRPFGNKTPAGAIGSRPSGNTASSGALGSSPSGKTSPLRPGTLPSSARTGLKAAPPQKTANTASAIPSVKPAGTDPATGHPADNNISLQAAANGVKTTTLSSPGGKPEKKKEPSVFPWIVASVIIGAVILVLLILIIVRRFGPRSIQFVEYTGMIDVERDDDNVDTEPEMKLKSGDLVTVNSGSTLSLLIDSDKHLEFDPDSSFYVYATGSKGKGKTHIDLIEGSALVILDKKLGGGATFEVTTPNATLDVRGTTFVVSYSSYTDATNVSVTEGTVSVTYGEGQSAELMAGNGCSIEGEEYTERNKPYFTVTRLYPEYKDTPPDPEFLRFAYTLKGREKPSTFNLASGAASDGENALATEAFNLNQSYMGANEDEIRAYMDSYRLSKLNQPAPETPDGDTMSGWYLDTFSYGNPDEREITDWFPEVINLQLDTGSKKFHVTRVVMWPQVFDEYLSNGVVQDAYVKELGFGFYGYME